MQCLTQLASPVHLPGSSRGFTPTFTRHDRPLLAQSHSSGVLSPPSCTLIMTWCICACHTLEGGHLSSVKYRSLPAPKWSHSSRAGCQQVTMTLLWDEPTLRLHCLSFLCVSSHEVLLGLCYSLGRPQTLMCSLGLGLFLHWQRSQPFHLPIKKICITEIFNKLPRKVMTVFWGPAVDVTSSNSHCTGSQKTC